MNVERAFGRKHPGKSFADHPWSSKRDNMTRYNHPGVARGAIVLQVAFINNLYFDSFFLEKIGRK